MNVLKEIQQQANEYPTRLAFVNTENKITFGELWAQSEQLASHIINLDLKKKSPIIVYGHMEPSMIVAFLACVKAGHPYVPVDITIPENRVNKIIVNSEAEYIINISDNEVSGLNSDISIFDYSLTKEVININPSHVPEDFWVGEEETFYIIYTSGSTGNPKGVQIALSNLNSFVKWILADFDIREKQTFLNQAPFSFDLSVMDLYPALASGGTIFALDKNIVASPRRMFVELNKSELNVWVSTPSFIQICLMEPSFHQDMLPELKTLLFCGEILPVQTAKELRKRFPKAVIYNTYGPTETTVAVTSIKITDNLLINSTVLPVGTSKRDTIIVIMGDNGEILRDGEKGEIIIIGPSVGKGYFRAEELSSKSFFVFNEKPAYKTGDSGYMKKGVLYCAGRLDFQIKLNGYRMELEEIERNILLSEYVKSVVLLPHYNGEKIDYLVAAVLPAEHSFQKEFELTKAIKKELQNQLPAYMVPRVFKYVQALPLTNNGKIDRKRVAAEVLS